ncbi:ABC transporter ATP-binding protein [filamentous cyanobacterium LEGE 11480]|uniref:ABC transporter ATP-binding protein n=1 Tax=Romeriopsis navalis LEGE 11480 TaxID=2777977 RepID=A0A928VS27_9CYAN|nr:ABC transporter ATP-binding protein [Romeriopsis navalis]MBE9031522.1 ABC transporter ATP-binding protein [Romeriopsis navalis LEGE 11480]
MTEPMLDVRNLRVQFKTGDRVTEAVRDISFQVRPGQTLGIVGESGSGKSVTSLAVMGLIPNPPGQVTAGEIWFQPDVEHPPVNLLALSRQELQRLRGLRMAMIFQEPMSSLNPVYTIGFQMVEAIAQHEQMPEAAARRRALDLLQEVQVLPEDDVLRAQIQQDSPKLTRDSQLDQEVNRRKMALLERYPHQLSGGQLQRVMIAIAISCNPQLLIADEPTTALDVTVQAAIIDLLRELRDRRGMSIVFITHDLGLIAEIADEVAVMYRGEIVEQGSLWQIFAQPQHPYTKGLLTCRPQPDLQLKVLPIVSDFMDVTELDSGEVLIESVGGDVQQVLDALPVVTASELAQRNVELQAKQPLLSVRDLSVAFPIKGVLGRVKRYTMAVNRVSFDVFPGETLGLVGESGCGKTTLSRTLLRLIEPQQGQAIFNGKDIFSLSTTELRNLRRELQIVFQNPFSSLDPRIAIGDAVMEPLKIFGKSDRKSSNDRVAYLLERVGLNPDWRKRFPHEFSGGQRQRVCIARALALNPKFIICDESVSALDVSVQAQVLNLLKELQSEFDLTYIFISHDLSVVKFMSDRIMVMNQGRLEEINSAEMIYRQPQQEYTKKLIASIPVGNLDHIRERQQQRGYSVS